MNFNWQEFEKEKITVCCETKEETLDFIYRCKERGYKIDEGFTLHEDCEIIKNYSIPKLVPLYHIRYFSYSINFQRVMEHRLDYDKAVVTWRISKPYRIYELEEGKTYIKKREEYNSNPELYKVKGNELLYYNDAEERWEECLITYNAIKNETFIVFEENQKEINWYKVAKGTKVQVKNKKEDKWKNAYFLNPLMYEKEIMGEKELVYMTTFYTGDKFTSKKIGDIFEIWNYCRIHPSVTIPNEWYKD